MTEPVFVDIGYIIALLVKDDAHHAAARHWHLRVRRERIPLVTTTAILTELGDGFHKPDQWARVRPVLEGMRADPNTRIVRTGGVLFEGGLALRAARPDKSWGLTDCISFCVMSERGINSALSADKHFVQAGFRALLLE